mmetsp:Transcript_5835/g.18736  ORF Transcript_5835/g.18736 Transcript_5835/m.18736 type:complete len:279 (+) Transcript_5835:268-1104(+)
MHHAGSLSDLGEYRRALASARDDLRLLGSHHGLHGHRAQHLGDADGAHGGGAAAREGVAVGAAGALDVQVHAAGGERADVEELRQLGGRRRRVLRGEDGGLLAEMHLVEVVMDLADVIIDGNGDDGPKLLFVPELHLGRNGVADGGEEQRAVPMATGLVDDLGPLCLGVLDELVHVLRLHRGQRRDGLLAERRARREARDASRELLRELLRDALVDHDELDRSATLTVVGRAAQETLLGRHIKVRVGEHHAQILGIQRQQVLQAVGGRVLLHKRVGRL